MSQHLHRVRIQVIKVYDVDVKAMSEEEAISAALDMQSTKIAEEGKFVEVTTDYAEYLGEGE